MFRFLRDLVPLEGDLTAEQSLIANDHVRSVRQRPVAYSCAAEPLNRHMGMPTAVEGSAAVGPDERPVGNLQDDVDR